MEPITTTKGCFIVFEGIDGSGKTSLSSQIARVFENRGLQVVKCQRAYFPTTQTLLDQVRQEDESKPRTIALAYALDYFMQMEMVIAPALKSGKLVISDRYILSSIAYNTAFGLELQWSLNLYQESIMPDKVFFLEIAPQLSLSRTLEQDPLARGFNQDTLKFQQTVRENYHLISDSYDFTFVDASKTFEGVVSTVTNLVELELKQKGMLK